MKESNFYKYAAILLLVINVGLLAFVFTRKPPHHRPHADGKGMENHQQKHQDKAAKMLNLDEAQKATFIALATTHRQQMIAIDEEQKRLLDNGFKGLTDTAQMVSFSQDLKKIEALEGEKITKTFAHFREIKAMLRTEQLTNFEKFMEGAKQHLLGKKGKRKGRK